MRIALPLAILAAPALAVTAFANEPEKESADTPSEATEPTETAVMTAEEQKVEPVAKEEKRICRRIRTDISSRRKEKVCMTSEEWRAYNQRR